ncbi:MAG: hypothetical protein K6T88_17090, partial [Bacillus sp. (in: Bacteria)]|nr:hypothetical protein [Bacillus sp. (in: firmicutes)]
GLGLPVYFIMAKIFYKWILYPARGLKYNLLLYLIIGSISASAHILPILLFSTRIYHPGWFENPGRDSIALGAVFYLCDSLIYCLMIKINWKKRWTKYILTGFLMFTVNQVLIRVGILNSLLWWDQPYYVSLSLILLLLTGIIDKRLTKGSILVQS